MATYTELFTLSENGTLLQRVAVACVIQANAIRQESNGTNLANRQRWAREVLNDPVAKGRQMLWAAGHIPDEPGPDLPSPLAGEGGERSEPGEG